MKPEECSKRSLARLVLGLNIFSDYVPAIRHRVLVSFSARRACANRQLTRCRDRDLNSTNALLAAIKSVGAHELVQLPSLVSSPAAKSAVARSSARSDKHAFAMISSVPDKLFFVSWFSPKKAPDGSLSNIENSK